MSRELAKGSVAEVFSVFLRLGLTTFGGPVAHIGYYRAELVERRKWLDEPAYGDIVALCQFLPGPARARPASPSASCGPGCRAPCRLARLHAAVGGGDDPVRLGVARFGDRRAAWLHGLKIVAVAVVAQAVWGMARSLAPDRERAGRRGRRRSSLAVASPALGQVGAIVPAGWSACCLCRRRRPRRSRRR